MNQLEETVIIRDRGQVTIPESIRRSRKWAAPKSVVTVSTDKPNEIVIRPGISTTKVVDWNKLWKNIELSRSYKGKYHGSLSKFIAKDRETRR